HSSLVVYFGIRLVFVCLVFRVVFGLWDIRVIKLTESAKSTALGAAATGTGETTIVGGLKYSSKIVTYEDEAKRRNSGAKTKIFEEIIFCYYTPHPAMRIRRISASSAQETRNDQLDNVLFGLSKRRICSSKQYGVFSELNMAYSPSTDLYDVSSSIGYGVEHYKEFEELIKPFKDPELVSQLDRKLLKTIESLVKTKQKGAILELKRRHLKNIIFCYYTSYPAMKIRRISASSAQETGNDQFSIWRITLHQYIVCTAGRQSKIQKEKLDRKNEIKARRTLLMALLNKDQLKFYSYQDAKFLMEAIEKRCGGNKESKKRNKAEIETISLDDLYNNLKIYKPELTGSSSTSQNPQNVAFVSSNSTNNTDSTSSTNEADNNAYGVSTAHIQGNAINSTSVDNLNDAVIYAFLASQPKSPQLAREDLKQIDPDNLEEMDLKWEMAMLTIRARRGREYGRKIVPVENPTENALIAQDGSREYDWSYQAEEGHPINFALMALTSSRSSSNSYSKGVCSTIETKPVRKNNFYPPIIEDWISDDESKVEFEPKVKVKSVRPCIEKIKIVKTTKEKVEKSMKIMMVDLCSLEMVKVEYLEKTFITGIENQLDCKVKVIRCDNETEFKNSVMNQFYDINGIKREFSVARTPQQNGVAERKNRTLIEAARTIAPLIDFMKPFGCPVTILNTRDYLGKFDKQANEGFFVGYYVVRTKDNIVACQAEKQKEPEQVYILIPICTTDPLISQGPKDSAVDAGKKDTKVNESQVSDNGGQDDQVTRNKWAISTKWVFRNKKDERGIVIKNKAILVAQEHIQEEGIDYDEVFAPVARIKAIRLFLAYASFKDIVVYQMDVKSAFLYGKIEEELYVYQPPGFEDPNFPDKVYKVEKALYGLRQAPRAWPDITFAVCACVRFQVTPKTSHLHAVKRIFRYLKGQPKLGLWYPRDSPFDLEAYSNSDYAGASLDRKSIIGEYVTTAASYCGQVLQIQNQMLDYGFNLMNTKIYIDNESTICIVKNPVFHSKTNHIEIRHHFIRDSYENKLIQVIKIHTDHNIADLLTKAFDQRMGDALWINLQVKTGNSSLNTAWQRGKYQSDLKFDDAEGIACLPNDTIFTELARMSAKTTAWNELSSTMASVIICLATNQKFNFSKYIFDNMVKHFDGGVKFLMLPIFLQKKIKPKRKQRRAAKVHSHSSEIPVKESVPTPSNDPLPSGEDSIQLNELMIFHTSLQQRVLDLEEAKIAQSMEIAKLKNRVKKLEKRRKSRPTRMRRLKKVGTSKQVESSKEKDSLGAQEDASIQGRNIEDIDQDAEIALVDEAHGRKHDAEMFRVYDLEGNEVFVDARKKTVKKEVSVVDPVTTAGEVVNAASVEDSATPTTATTADVDDELTLEKTLIEIKAAKPKVISTAITTPRAKGIVFHKKVQAHKPIVSSSKDKCKAKMIELEKPLKKKAQIALDEEVARKLEDDVHATIDADRQSRAREESAKKQKLAELEQAKVADDDNEELKRCLEIVPGDDDDVAIEATPLSSKSPTIVDYKIYREGKKSYSKIIGADENSQNYLSFGTMFKNFNREDLEVLRSIVKERFKKTKPVDDMKNLLFQTLKTMFEPHVEDII
nr:putative reverse transcriptase, RNA-dependent DNA polymerase [Tanacetum cinerariifolium]